MRGLKHFQAISFISLITFLITPFLTRADAYLFSGVTNQFITEYFERHEEKLARQLKKKQMEVEKPSHIHRTDVILTKLSNWFKADAGKVDPKGLFAPFETYNSDGVLKRSCFEYDFTLPCPKKGIGTYLKTVIHPNFYMGLGWVDPNGCKNKIGYETPFDHREYFRMIEAGYEEKNYGRFYVSGWNRDPLKKKKKPGGHGFVSHAERVFGDWVPYIRYSQVFGGCFDMKRSFSIGLGRRAPFFRKKDRIGLAGVWGIPCSKKHRKQATIETHYKCQLTSALCVTPHFQFSYHPFKDYSHSTELAGGVKVKSSF